MAFNYYTIIIGFLIGFILFFKLPRLKKIRRSKVADIKISVIIPARNEEDNLPKILTDLKKQSYDIHEIICVDDNSEDATPEVIRDFGVKCIQLGDLPEGWKGKPWACQNGAKVATGDVLIFLDADVRLSNTAIELLAIRYQQGEKPLSILPYHIIKNPHEFFSIFFNLIKICGTAMSIIGIKKRFGLYGPVFMVKSTLFERYGGFEGVKESVAEDLNLGRYYVKNKVDMDLYLGGQDIRFRMYPSSFKDLLEGWSKNFSSGSISIRWWILVLVFIWIASLNAVPLEMIRNFASGNYSQLVLLGFIYMVFAVLLFRIARRAGAYPIYVCLFYPFYLIVFELIFIYSIFATFVIKNTTWKGRKL